MTEVSRIDLTPKRKRPLSLSNPLDYLLLLYWVFYFPQAIRWYVKTFCESPAIFTSDKSEGFLTSLRQNPLKLRLGIQGFILLSLVLSIFCFIALSLGIFASWKGALGGVLIGSLLGAVACIAFGLAGGIGVIIALSIGLGVGLCFVQNILLHLVFNLIYEITNLFPFSIPTEMENGIILGIIFGITIGVPFGITGGILAASAGSVTGGVKFGIPFGIAVSFSVGIPFGIITSAILNHINRIGNTYENILFSIVFGIFFGTTTAISIAIGGFRFDSYFHCLVNGGISHVTPLIIPGLEEKLIRSLKHNWNQGLIDANQILQFSLQFLAIDRALNIALQEMSSDKIIDSVVILSDNMATPYMIRYTYTSLRLNLATKFIDEIHWMPHKSQIKNFLNLILQSRSRKEVKIVGEGLWYLNEASHYSSWHKRASSLTKAVNVLKNLNNSYGEELYLIAFILRDFSEVIYQSSTDSSKNIFEITIPEFTRSKPLRPDFWLAINSMRIIFKDVNLVSYSTSNGIRSMALNRSLGRLTKLIDDIMCLPSNQARFERGLLLDIAAYCQELLLKATKEFGQYPTNFIVENPYTIGDPVYGRKFIGREDILCKLEEIWGKNGNLQSIILFGHRRMGKTSIIRNITPHLGPSVNLVYVNLLTLGSVSNGAGDILMAICEAISEVTHIPAPINRELKEYPEITFQRYFKNIEKIFGSKGLIIALDEFEKLEDLINTQKISPDFLEFLRGMVQASPNIAFAFAGLHTLEEMAADYFQPFFASFIPIRVAFLTPDATHQVLANPDPEFLLEYEPATLNLIYQLTHGQPYLTQLIGFQLVRLYNDFVFEQGHPRDPIFTPADVEAICDNQQFFTTGSNYFNGVWNQANEGAPCQQTILRALAANPQGLTIIDLAQHTTLTPAQIDAALETLHRHDVVHKNPGQSEASTWQITVELFRIWVEREKQNGIR